MNVSVTAWHVPSGIGDPGSYPGLGPFGACFVLVTEERSKYSNAVNVPTTYLPAYLLYRIPEQKMPTWDNLLNRLILTTPLILIIRRATFPLPCSDKLFTRYMLKYRRRQ